MAHEYALIMAGGRGTRFWPRSRRRTAKQVLNVIGEGSLIRQTAERLAPMVPPERTWVLTNAALRDTIVRQLPEVPERQIVAEPAQRNTAPCNGLAARILRSLDPDAVIGVFPADHVIARPDEFRALLQPAYDAAARGHLAVVGIQPRWPETGYGYLEFGEGVRPGALQTFPVLRFREKPSLDAARGYIESGRFYWNAGMFFWRADVFLEALGRHAPAVARVLEGLPRFEDPSFNARLGELYPACENISVDFAVMEKAGNVVGVPAGDIGWNDVGSWHAVYELLPHDAGENASRSELLARDSRGNYVDAGQKLVALLGVENLIVVETPDALLVADRSRAQEVGELVKMLEKQGRDELL